MRTSILLFILLATAPAHAGPYCGNETLFSPGGGTLPVRPTIAIWIEDSYYADELEARARAPKVSATIGGKPVPITVTDTRTTDGIVRKVRVDSKKTGKLVIETRDRITRSDRSAEYVIASDWTAPDPDLQIRRSRDNRLSVYHRSGDILIASVALPVVMFNISWRRDADDRWHAVRGGPGRYEDEGKGARSEAWLGNVMCGAINNFPVSLATDGVELDISALLPDGSTVDIGETFVKLPEEPAPTRRVSPPGAKL